MLLEGTDSVRRGSVDGVIISDHDGLARCLRLMEFSWIAGLEGEVWRGCK
jgi:hypothetical protein